jgi:hypothetical protein
MNDVSAGDGTPCIGSADSGAPASAVQGDL